MKELLWFSCKVVEIYNDRSIGSFATGWIVHECHNWISLQDMFSAHSAIDSVSCVYIDLTLFVLCSHISKTHRPRTVGISGHTPKSRSISGHTHQKLEVSVTT